MSYFTHFAKKNIELTDVEIKMEKNTSLDDALAKEFAQKMFDCNLWWSCTLKAGEAEVIASAALEKILGRKVYSINDLMGKYATALPMLKIEDASRSIQSQNAAFSRFVVSFETTIGKRSYQNQLQVVTESPYLTFLINCIDVSEMVEFEREIVDAQGRLSITQAYEKQELLENQNRVIKESYAKQSRFLGLLSHELRSPLLGITSLVKRLRKRLNGDKEVGKMLKTISMTAQQSTYLVNDILTYTQAEYDGLKLHPSSNSLGEILENVKQLTKSLANDKSLNLSVIQLIKHDQVFVDSVRLTQVLINLIINGIKFTELGGVNLEVKEQEGSQYRFIVSDSGEGIPVNSLQKIFKPFAQIEADEQSESNTGRYLGAGLGLFVVKEIIDAMGGDIKVSSQERVGTQFEFILNLSKPATQTLKQAKESFNEQQQKNRTTDNTLLKSTETSKELNKPLKSNESDLEPESPAYKVLIADDSEINRMVLAGYLDDLQCQIDEAVDGRSAWQKLQNNTYDYVLLDIQMPWMDGIEVAKKLQELRLDGKHKVLKGVFAITAGGESEDFDYVNDLKQQQVFDEWLVKPVNKKQIMNLLKTYSAKENLSNDSLNNKSGVKNASLNFKQKSGNNALNRSNANEKLANDAFNINQIPSAFHHLIDPFLNEMQQNITKLKQLNLEAESYAIKELAHYMKGNAMLFQLDNLVELCKELERLNASNEVLQNFTREEASSKTINHIEDLMKTIKQTYST